jgi:hypothetical protein
MVSKGRELATFVMKLDGKEGLSVLVGEIKKLNLTVKDLDDMDENTKARLLEGLINNWLSTYFAHGRFLMARAELIKILELPMDSYKIKESDRKPKSPSMMGRPKT